MYCACNPKGREIKTDGFATIDRAFVAHYQVSANNATTGSTSNVLGSTALTTSTQVITTGITNPSVPRSIRIIGNVAGITGNVVIKGTNFNGDSIAETIALNGTTTVEGNKAFATVTEIDLPIQSASGNVISIGSGEKLGIPYKLTNNTVLLTFLNNVKESTAPTVTTDGENLENNTVKLNSSLDGNTVDVYLLV